MSVITSKKYYKIKFELQSPLSIGSGISDETDSDIIVDSIGCPYIPGSAMAGVYRRMLDSKAATELFGKLLVGTNKIDESSVITYNGVLCGEQDKKIYIGKRDMVELNDYKVAKDGSKFDMQILEPGVKMVSYIEVNSSKIQIDEIDQILNIWKTSGISFGSKTKRGYGLTKAIEIEEAYFDFTNNESKEKWLNFNIYDEGDENWSLYDSDKHLNDNNSSDYVSVKLVLRQIGGLSVREYSTRVGEADYEQMRLHNEDESNHIGIAVIPGTSWAGAFRNQMKRLGMDDTSLKELFGVVKKKNDSDKIISHQSRIAFSESYIMDGVDIEYTRNVIDRFSGGAVKEKLYTDRTRYDGATELLIQIEKKYISMASPYLAASIMDLSAGYMSIGGLTSIGRGLFNVICCKVNEKEINLDYLQIKEALG